MTLVVFLIYTQVENHVLNPVIMSRTVRINPLLVLVAILVGASIGSWIGGFFGGFVAALLAIPAAGAIQVIVKTVWQSTAPARRVVTRAAPRQVRPRRARLARSTSAAPVTAGARHPVTPVTPGTPDYRVDGNMRTGGQQRQPGRRLDLLQPQVRHQPLTAPGGQRGQHLLKLADVPCDHREEVVHLAGHVVSGDDLRQRPYLVLEQPGRPRVVPAERRRDVHLEREPNSSRIQPGADDLDDA